METLQITDPLDWSYPFSRALYEDSTIVYHGTASNFAAAIERDGLVAGVPHFPIDEIQELVTLSDALNLRSWSYGCVKGLASGAMLERPSERCVFLSANFWFARDYATNVGGETVQNAIILADELATHLRATGGSSDVTNRVSAIQADLVKPTAGSFPIVYALRVDGTWLKDKGGELRRRNLGDMVAPTVNISCLRSVPSDRLLAKAEYVSGAGSGYIGPQPISWDEARRLGRRRSTS